MNDKIKKLREEIYALVAETDTKEEAVAAKEALMRPIGALNEKFQLRPERCYHCSAKRRRALKSKMNGTGAY